MHKFLVMLQNDPRDNFDPARCVTIEANDPRGAGLAFVEFSKLDPGRYNVDVAWADGPKHPNGMPFRVHALGIIRTGR